MDNFKHLEDSLLDTINSRNTPDDPSNINNSLVKSTYFKESTEELIESLIYAIGYEIREHHYFSKSRFKSFYIILFSQIPAIFLNLLKILFNIINSTLINPVFDMDANLQTVGIIGRLKIRMFSNDWFLQFKSHPLVRPKSHPPVG